MNILFIGDVFGSPGRRIVCEQAKQLAAEHAADLVIANGENAAAGYGITPPLVQELLDAGIDVLTGGNHIFDRKEILPFFEQGAAQGRLLRPANYPGTNPGSGVYLGKTGSGIPYAVLSIQGRVFMPALDCPFRTADRLLENLPSEVKVVLVDAHGEATSEKQALGFYLDGRVSAVVGTHTHVPTADEKILPGGNDKRAVLERFLTGLNKRMEVGKDDVRLCGVTLDIDEATGRARRIQRFAHSENQK